MVVFAFGAVVKEELPIAWPKKYSFEKIRISVTGGLVENMKVWHTSNRSRIDYNNGAVKTFTVSFAFENEYGIKYEVHPVTNQQDTNEMVCNKRHGSSSNRIEAETGLPTLMKEYKYIGVDTLRGDNYSIYYCEEVDVTNDKYTLTVNHDEENNIWIPIRYEKIEYNIWLESVQNHEVWEFHNFQTDFDDDIIFDTSEYDCDKSSVMYTLDDEKVTKSLLLMDPENIKHVDHAFETFKRKHDRVYSDDDEHAMRKSIFLNNMRRVIATNRLNLGYKLSINKFADRTPDEMKRYTGLKKRSKNDFGTISFPYSDTQVKEIVETLPKNFDARVLGLVTPVRDQKECKSCWSFGATSAVEGALARSNGGRLLRLSNQALIDCAWSFGAEGCDGGSDTAAYNWITKYGIPTEEEYGIYNNRDGLCRIGNMTDVYKIRGFTDVTPLSVDALKVAVVNHGPLSVSMHCPENLILYSGGIFYDQTCDSNLNHEVTLVGYGERDGETYWIIKNSWGSHWGMDGYFHITTRDNNCGITTEATYPVF
ncbi:unnamed protein product, partial [Iphiclides podalirius]